MKNNKTIVIVSAKKGGLFVNAEIKDPKGLEALVNRPPVDGGIVRVASVRGTRPGQCILFWKDDNNKTVEVAGNVI